MGKATAGMAERSTPAIRMDEILFHPPLVHFPIAFFVLEFILLGLWFRRGDPAYRRFALFSFRLGYGLILPTMIAGLVDAQGLPPMVRPHFLSALSLFLLSTVRAFQWRFQRREGRKGAAFLLAGSLLTCLVVGVTGYFGGKLAFE